MADKIIAASLQVDTGNSNKNIQEVNKSLKETNAQLNETQEAADGAGTNVKAAGGSFGKLKEQLGAIPGPAGQAVQGVKGLGNAFKALLANPIVLLIAAIVGALVLLYKAFTSTNDGADKMEQIMDGLGAVIDVIRDRFLKLAGAIGKFFSGDFKGALADARGALSGIGDEIAAEFNKAADATRRLQEVEDALRDLGVSRAKLNKDLAATKEIISDETATFQEKKKAIEAVRKAEGEQTFQELENAKKKLKAIQDRNNLSDKSDEDLQKEADAQKEVYRLEEESAKNIRSLNKQERSIEKAEQAKQKAAADEARAKEKEERQKFAEFTNKLTQLQQANELAMITDTYQKELRALEIKTENEKKVNEQAVKDKRLTLEQAAKLNEAAAIQADLARQAIEKKHQDELKLKEDAFQKELAKIRQDASVKSILDTRQSERLQLQIGYEEKLNDAITRYKDDATKLAEIRTAIIEQQRADEVKLEEKFRLEDEKKKLELAEQTAKNTLQDPNQSFDAKQAALDAELVAYQAALDAKVLSEEQYNVKVAELTNARNQLAIAERDQRIATFGQIGNAFETLSNIVGKKTAAGKALAVAAATISAIQSAVNSFNSLSVIPIVGPALGAVAAAGAIAAGIANVKKIIAVKVPGGDGGGGSVPSIQTPTAPLAPTQGSTKIDASSIQDIGNANKGAIKTFVVDSDVGNQRDRQARLERQATLGG